MANSATLQADMETIAFPHLLQQIHSAEELRNMAIQGAILIDYFKGNISMMKAAELLETDYDGMTELLSQLNIPSMGNLPESLQSETKDHREQLAQQLGIN